MAFPDMENSGTQNSIVAGAAQQGEDPLIGAEACTAALNPVVEPVVEELRRDVDTIVVSVVSGDAKTGMAEKAGAENIEEIYRRLIDAENPDNTKGPAIIELAKARL
ncbi:MAG: hypothetical protein V1926_05710, partial [Candidatus Peregrinibacteria bacterium]